jgi:hypothetical protein
VITLIVALFELVIYFILILILTPLPLPVKVVAAIIITIASTIVRCKPGVFRVRVEVNRSYCRYRNW